MAAEKKTKAKRKPRELKDAGERVVLVAVEVPAKLVTERLEKQGEGIKGIQIETNKDGKAIVWVKLGQVEAEDRSEAVDKAVGPDTVGSFRSPPAAGWRGQINRTPPAQVALDVTITD